MVRSNMDRMIAIWQALHDESWFDPGRTVDTPSTHLRPFHKDEGGTYWDSNAAREVTPHGYTYPMLEKWLHRKPDGTYDKVGHLKAINETLTAVYNSSRSAAEKADLTADPGQTEGLKLMSLSAMLKAAPDRDAPLDRTVDDYIVNIIYER